MADQVDDIAGRIVLIVDASVPAAARAACADAAATLAQRAGMPVTLAVVPIETVDAVQPVIRRGPGQIRDLDPPPVSSTGDAMTSAPFVWRRDGRPDWGAMWTTFCDLALHGGPPQRGALQALRGPSERRSRRHVGARDLGRARRGNRGDHRPRHGAGRARDGSRSRARAPAWRPGSAPPSSWRTWTRAWRARGSSCPPVPDSRSRTRSRA